MKHPFRTLLGELFVMPLLAVMGRVVGMFSMNPTPKGAATASAETHES
jgi:hypothetical protein